MDEYIIVLKLADTENKLIPIDVDKNGIKLLDYACNSQEEAYHKAQEYIDFIASYYKGVEFEIDIYKKIQTPEKPITIEIKIPNKNTIKQLKNNGILEKYGITIMNENVHKTLLDIVKTGFPDINITTECPCSYKYAPIIRNSGYVEPHDCPLIDDYTNEDIDVEKRAIICANCWSRLGILLDKSTGK